MYAFLLKNALLFLCCAAILLFGGYMAMHLYNAGKATQAGKDQPKVTQAVVGEIAAGVASGVSQGASQAETKRLTKAQDTRKVTQAAEEALSHVLQQLPPSSGPMEVPQDTLASPMGMDIPDSIADAYLSGLQRVRDSGTSGPTAFHKCPGNAGTWLICS